MTCQRPLSPSLPAKSTNSLGSADRQLAQVLFTTQQRIGLLCRGSSFSDTEAFFYQGRSRQIRVWDEAFLPAMPLVISRDSLMKCIESLRRDYSDQARALDDFLIKLERRVNG